MFFGSSAKKGKERSGPIEDLWRKGGEQESKKTVTVWTEKKTVGRIDSEDMHRKRDSGSRATRGRAKEKNLQGEGRNITTVKPRARNADGGDCEDTRSLYLRSHQSDSKSGIQKRKVNIFNNDS